MVPEPARSTPVPLDSLVGLAGEALYDTVRPIGSAGRGGETSTGLLSLGDPARQASSQQMTNLRWSRCGPVNLARRGEHPRLTTVPCTGTRSAMAFAMWDGPDIRQRVDSTRGRHDRSNRYWCVHRREPVALLSADLTRPWLNFPPMTTTSGPAHALPGRRRRGMPLLLVKLTAGLLSFAILVGSGVAWATYQNFTTSIATGASLPTPAATDAPDIDGVAQNILLIGNDTRVGATPAELKDLGTEDDGGASNTDTMIVLHVPADGSKATLISFPRDSYVDIPGVGRDRINAAYGAAYRAAISQGLSENDAEGQGVLLTAKTIENLTGLTIDHYLMIKLLGFYRISKAIGGVDVCLNNDEVPATQYGQKGDGFDSGFEGDQFVYSYSGINLHKGVNHIEGTQALAFVRQRHGLINGDLDRVARQRYFLGAVFRTALSGHILLNPFKLQSLLSAVSSSLVKDRELDLLKLAAQLQNLASGNIIGATIVTNGPKNIDGKDVLDIDPAAVKAQMKVLIGAPSPVTSTAPTPVATVPADQITV